MKHTNQRNFTKLFFSIKSKKKVISASCAFKFFFNLMEGSYGRYVHNWILGKV